MIFVVLDSQETLQQFTYLILDPLKGHPDKVEYIEYLNIRETVPFQPLPDIGMLSIRS